MALWTLDSVLPWWNVDLWVHPFTRPYGALLEHTITLLKLTIESITQLMLPLGELQRSPEQLAVFKLVQIITRVNVAYRQWQERGSLGDNSQVRKFLLEGFKGLPTHSGVATAQIIAVSKREDPKGLESLLSQSSFNRKPFNQMAQRSYQQRNSFRGRGGSGGATHGPGRGGASGYQTKVICYNCGKKGHTKKACRLNKPHNMSKSKIDNDSAQ